ncbi:hypothetical protein FRX31_033143 [Thalictrum thalictroides]|uniref:Uncharacterized protein n=1 Tax=Thalictrum thalictroides TaxID=46969 RepID=A0A7J6UXR6_THATH|nr:hypothetical protein FRX31_033143 [Thalictrum thalictroides]
MGMYIDSAIIDVRPNEPGGTWNFAMRVSNCNACCTPNVFCWSMITKHIMPDVQTGIIPTRLFSCSTCFMLQSLHSFTGKPLSSNTSCSVMIAALSRYLNLSV